MKKMEKQKKVEGQRESHDQFQFQLFSLFDLLFTSFGTQSRIAFYCLLQSPFESFSWAPILLGKLGDEKEEERSKIEKEDREREITLHHHYTIFAPYSCDGGMRMIPNLKYARFPGLALEQVKNIE